MPQSETAKAIEDLSFEQALEELEGIVRALEQGQTKLEASIQAYERGSQLRAHCEAKLRQAQGKIDRISRAADGSVVTDPIDLE